MQDHCLSRCGRRISFAESDAPILRVDPDPQPVYRTGVNCDSAIEAQGFNFGDSQAVLPGGIRLAVGTLRCLSGTNDSESKSQWLKRNNQDWQVAAATVSSGLDLHRCKVLDRILGQRVKMSELDAHSNPLQAVSHDSDCAIELTVDS